MAQQRLSEAQTDEVLRALQKSNGNKSDAARMLGLHRNTFLNRLEAALSGRSSAKADPDTPAPKAIVDERVELKDRIRSLEAMISAHRRETLDEKYVREKILDLKDGFGKIDPPEWLMPQTKRRGPSQSVPTLLLSDLHWGETVDPAQVYGVNEYNIEIANARLKRVIEKAITLARTISGVAYPGFVLPLGGDMLAGEIHEELVQTNDVPVLPALLNLLEGLIPAIQLLADEFGFVYVPCVAGNHGRMSRKPRAKSRNVTNLDWLLYQFLALHFKDDERVKIDSPVSPEVTYHVFNHAYHLNHGDQLGKGGDGIIGFLGPVVRGDHKNRSLQAQFNNPYDTMLHGHFHQYLATRRFVSNGSLVGYDEYALANKFPYEIPQQAFWLTHAEEGMTYAMPVHAEPPKIMAPRPWVSFEDRAS